MIEKTFDAAGGLDAPLKAIAKIIHGEVNGFISDSATPKSIIAHFKKQLKKQDFTDMVFEIAGCRVAYNLCKIGNLLALSSAFDLPRHDHKVAIGPFQIGLRLENFHICLDTSKATDVIQFYLALEKFGETTVLQENPETIKTSEMFKLFEDMGYTFGEAQSWHKQIKNSAGKMVVQIVLEGSLDNPIYKHHMDMLSVAMMMIEAE